MRRRAEKDARELQRLDWRFLLPGAGSATLDRIVVAGGPPHLPERLRRLGIAREVRDRPPAAPVDAVFLLVGARWRPDQVAPWIEPGGVLYWEVDRRHPAGWLTGPGHMIAALEDAGVRSAGTWAVLPGHGAPEVFLPVESPAALRWYVRTRFSPSTPLRRLGEGLLRVLTALRSDRLARLAPALCAAGVVDGSAEVRGEPAPLLGSKTASDADGPLRALMLSGGGNRVTLLPFREGGEHPETVLKVPKVPETNDRGVNEQEKLSRIRSVTPAALRAALPRPLGTVNHGELVIVRESHEPGTSLARSSGAWGGSREAKVEDLRIASGWLRRFHDATTLRRIEWDETAETRFVEADLTRFEAEFGITEAEERLFRTVRRASRDLRGASLPLVWTHRDFNVWNLLNGPGGLRVLDWEGSRPHLPLCDLFHFVTHWYAAFAHLRSPETRLEGFRKLFLDDGPPGSRWPARDVRREIDLYLSRLDLAPPFAPILLVLTWVELALRRLVQRRDLGESGGPREGNAHLSVVALLAASVPSLFGDGPAPGRVTGAGAPSGPGGGSRGTPDSS